MQPSAQKPLLVYDGVCNLCTGAVRFLIAIDGRHSIEYAPYQNLSPEVRKKLALSTSDLRGRMHIVKGNGAVLKGAAAIAAVCRLLAPILALCELFDTPLAERIYAFIASRRYQLFGCRGSCYSPDIVRTE